MLIRRAKESDVRSIAEVHVASSRATYGNLCDESFTVEAREIAWREWMPTEKTFTFVAENESGIVGFANFGPTRDSYQGFNNIGELYSVYVLPGNIGSGTGYELTTGALEQLRANGFQAVTLWVLESNQRARDFYERVGFSLDGTTRTSEKDGQHLVEVRYCKKFS